MTRNLISRIALERIRKRAAKAMQRKPFEPEVHAFASAIYELADVALKADREES